MAAVGKSQGWSFEPEQVLVMGLTWRLQNQMQMARCQGSLLNLRGNCEADWGCKGLLVRGGET